MYACCCCVELFLFFGFIAWKWKWRRSPGLICQQLNIECLITTHGHVRWLLVYVCEVIHMVNPLPSFSQAESNSNSKRVERYTCTWQRLQFIWKWMQNYHQPQNKHAPNGKSILQCKAKESVCGLRMCVWMCMCGSHKWQPQPDKNRDKCRKRKRERTNKVNINIANLSLCMHESQYILI